jgi:hypothetical protein
MSREETIVLVDDLDGTEPATKRTFGLDGVSYEIDLSEENSARLTDIFSEYLPIARKQPKAKKAAKPKARPKKPVPDIVA